MNPAALDHLIGYLSRSTARVHRSAVEKLEAYRVSRFGPREPQHAPVAKRKGRANG